MITIEEIRTRKIQMGYSTQQLSEKSGVPVGTLQKILSGATKAPRRDTLLALQKALTDNTSGFTYSLPKTDAPSIVCETAWKYGRKGPYTLDDYLALPEEQRVELIDGFFYDMAAPTTVHQGIGGFIHKQLLDHVLEKGGKCMPLMSPVDVQLDEDDKTVVQPDVLIVCNRDRFRNGRVFGAPDFIAEVLSKSTRKKDMQLKLSKYADAGVREYWMIDPEKRMTVVYDLEHEEFPKIYGSDAKIPVMVWGRDCEVDMGFIFQYLEFLYES